MGASWRLIGTLVAVAVAVVGCSGQAPSEAKAAAGISVVDDAGRTVKLDRPAQKVISLAPSNTELLYAIGAGNSIVGTDDYSDFPPDAKAKPKVGGFATTNMEQVVSLAPDLVLATNIHAKSVVPELERRGIPTVILQPKKMDAVLDSIKTVGQLTGNDREAATLSESLEKRMERVTGKTAGAKTKPRVFFELDAKLFSVGPGSFVDDMITKAGGTNLAADATTEWPQLNQEALLVKDPEVVLLADHAYEPPAKVKARPGWQVMTAVKNDRVFAMNPDLTNRAGPRVFDGLEEIARLLHPDLFK